jgi:anti-sigma28 factor (negative regulator of flagellin synthesis)
MNLTDTTTILKRLLAQTEHSIEQNGKELEDAKNECIKDSSTKMWIEANEERMIRYNEEVEALRQAIRNTQRQREYEDWTNKNF